MSLIVKPKLEICILSYNKSDYTIALLNSILQHEPKSNFLVSVLDQGSETVEIENLESGLRDSRVKLNKLDRNLGVGGGRQFQLNSAIGDYVVFLDNDLVIQSPFVESLMSTLKLGDFACLPFVELISGSESEVVIPSLFISPISGRKYETTFGLGSSSFNFKKIEFPFEISGVAGGVFAAHRERLIEVGGFRGPGKAGYEDLDLSLRLRNMGEKIFLVPISNPILHNKSISEESKKKNFDAVRLDYLELKANARFVEHNHKGHVWGRNQYDWLAKRLINQGINENSIDTLLSKSSLDIGVDSRPQILLVCDSPGWAFDRIARIQQTFFRNKWKVDICYSDNWRQLTTRLKERDWDSIVFLWRVPLFQLVREGFFSQREIRKISYCIYDHQGDLGYKDEVENLETLGVAIGVVNQTLYEDYRERHKNIFYIPDGVLTGLFKPPLVRKQDSQPIVIGWSGNTKWGGVDDVKGFSKVIKPCIELFKKNQSNVKFEFIDSSLGRIPQDIVAKCMQSWDVVLCTSRHEGTPNPVLEGLSVGLAVISTSVGMTRELHANGAKIRFIEQQVESLYSAINELSKDREMGLLEVERVSNRKMITNFDWRIQLRHHEIFLDHLLGT